MSKKFPQKDSDGNDNSEALTVPSKKELKKYSMGETRDKVLQNFHFKGDLNRALRELGDELLPKLLQGNEKEKAEVTKKLDEKVTEVMMALETETQWGLMWTFISEYNGMAKELTSQIIKENSCATYTEKMLAEVTAGSFIRYLDNSRRLNNELECKVINENRTKYITMLSKQVDRSHRQYLNSLGMLQQLKTPAIQMTIKAKTAFIAQNQQNNANQSDV